MGELGDYIATRNTPSIVVSPRTSVEQHAERSENIAKHDFMIVPRRASDCRSGRHATDFTQDSG